MAIILPNEKLVLNAYAVLVGETPGNAALEEHLAYIAANGTAAYTSVLNSIFADQSNAALATTMLANLGLSSIFTQAEAEAFLAGNAANRVGAMINLANALYNYSGSDAAIVAAHDAYVNAVDGSYNYSIDPTHVAGADLSGDIISGGQTLTLTQGLDTITGTSGNDTINAYAFNTITGADVTTLNSVDTINGGAGTDTLNIEVKDNGDGGDYNDVIQGSISNVEIININNEQATSAGAVDASKLGAAAQQIWQIDGEGAVTKLLATTTAGFAGDTDGTLNVAGATGAASVTVALDGVTDGAGANDITLNASGADLTTVNVSGTLADGLDDPATESLTINVTAGVDEQTVFVNTALDATVTVTQAEGSTKLVTTLDASGSTGAITFNGDVDVLSVTTAGGNDDVTLSYVATADDKTASVTTGAGDDTIVVVADADGYDGFAVMVDAGAGNDEITINAEATTVTAGAGDDIVHVTTTSEGDYRSLTDTDNLDGGEGTDTIVLGAATAILDAGDYVRLQDLSGFEHVRFEDAIGNDGSELDAAELSGFSQIEVTSVDGATLLDGTYDLSLGNDDWSFVKNIAADQTIVARGSAVLYTDGYVGPYGDADATNADAAALTLNVLSGADIGIFAKSAAITVDTTEAEGDVSFYIGDYAPSDLDSATITLVSTTDDDATTDYVASAYVYSVNAGDGFTSLTIDGTGSATVDNTGGKLATIDTSELGGTDVNGDAFAGLTFTGELAVKETVSVGSGIDNITIASEAGSTSLTKVDTITGLDLSLNDAGTDFAATSDTFTLDFSGITTTATEFVTKTFATAPASLGAALNTVSAMTDNAVVFQFDGNTYLFVEDEGGASANGNFEATDVVVKLTGAYDLADLAVMANQSL